MKELITITSLLIAGTALANAETFLKLPDSGLTPARQGWFQGNISGDRDAETAALNVLNKLKGESYGVHAGTNGGALSTAWSGGEGTEGYWLRADSNTSGTITLAGRNGTQGESFGLVLGNEIVAGTTFNTITFSLEIPVDSDLDGKILNLGLGLYSGSASIKTATSVSGALSATESSSVDLVLTLDSLYTWTEGDKIVAGVGGPMFTPPTNTYDINVKGVSYSTISVPEPSAFGLLAGAGALALVAARRRRQKKA